MVFKKGCVPWNKGKKTGIVPNSVFKKGHTPWHTGKKGLLKANSGSFKKGQMVGKNNFRWNGGKRTTVQGYVYVKCPEHPLSTKDGYYLEHRFNLENFLGRFLKRSEEVHHLDFDKKNNSPDNLVLFNSKAEHSKFHSKLNNLVKEVTGGLMSRWPSH